jgi:transposase
MSKATKKLPDDPTIWRVDDALWERLAPLLVIEKVGKKSGRPRKSDRQILDGLIWLARTGAQWDALPREFGASPRCMTAFRSGSATGCSPEPGRCCWKSTTTWWASIGPGKLPTAASSKLRWEKGG